MDQKNPTHTSWVSSDDIPVSTFKQYIRSLTEVCAGTSQPPHAIRQLSGCQGLSENQQSLHQGAFAHAIQTAKQIVRCAIQIQVRKGMSRSMRQTLLDDLLNRGKALTHVLRGTR